jgi:hypothetical protein
MIKHADEREIALECLQRANGTEDEADKRAWSILADAYVLLANLRTELSPQ